MFRNYLLVAIRNLVKNKLTTFINIGGLAAGMAVVMLNGLWIWDELSFNKYHQHYDSIAQVMSGETENGRSGINTSQSYPLATALKAGYQDDFKYLVLATGIQDHILSTEEKNIPAKGMYMEEAGTEMFTLKMIRGTMTALRDPYSIILSSSTARALFGDADPTGQLIRINNKTNVKVTGVYEDLPRNTRFHEANFFSPWELWVSGNKWVKERAINEWGNHFLRIYAEIQPYTDFDKVNAHIRDVELTAAKDFKARTALHPQVFLQPMSRWHLYSNFQKGVADNSPVRQVWLVGVIGVFVLLLACINFMNLSTARAGNRAKEVGIRKAVGSMRGQLMYQFFAESLLIVSLAFALATLLTFALLPWFNALAGKAIAMPWGNPYFWIAGLCFIFVTGVLAGSYPALFLSSFQPFKALKGTFSAGRLAIVPRKALVVAQFTVSVILICSTIIVYRQIQFAKDRPVGYTREGLITLRMKSPDFYGKYNLLRDEFIKTSVVADMSQSMGAMTELASGNNGMEWEGMKPGMNKSFGTLAVTFDHGNTVGWRVIAGRDFSRKFPTDSSGVIINESAAKYMDIQNPVGRTITWKFRDADPARFTILGVVRDMVMESPYEPVEPTLFFIKAPNGTVDNINIRIKPGVSASQALPTIEAAFKKLIPTAPFDYKFVDQEYALKFAAEERTGKLAGLFAILAVLISCLGLFGLASFMAEQRTKEIGIRKILGASVFNLWRLLCKDFVLLVILACLIAVPVSYYFLQQWLSNFTYRADMTWWIFAAAATGALLITILTVSFQSIKVALTNPAKSLRTE